jgi:hypothetical protein
MVGFFGRRDRAETLGIGFLALFVFALATPPLVVSAWVSPEDIESGRVSLSAPCPYKATHGVPCTSCGLTRGFAAMSRGRIRDAANYNALSPWFYAAAMFSALGSGFVSWSCIRRLRQLRRATSDGAVRAQLGEPA